MDKFDLKRKPLNNCFFNDDAKINKISNSELANKKILIVGAGGIGCELIKTLICSGAKNFSIVDMDTIEKTNLNRQFLFNEMSISKYKSEMVMKRVQELKPSQNIIISSYVGNIKDEEMFNLNFFDSHDYIVNALDNIDARMYVSNIAYKIKKYLINGGTEGLLGFVGVYNSLNPQSSCYNCTAKVKSQAIPICSIKSKPSKVEHCVAWAKHIFEQIFCSSFNDDSLNLLENCSSKEIEIIDLLEVLFKLDLENLINLSLGAGKLKEDERLSKEEMSKIKTINVKNYDLKDSIEYYLDFKSKYHLINNQIIEDNNNLLKLLIGSFRILIKDLKGSELDNNDSIKNILSTNKYKSFDKDHKEAVDFIFCMSNLRCFNFQIKQESRFKIQEIAGRIIPAIVSTNSIIAAIQTAEIVKINSSSINIRNTNINKERKIASCDSLDDTKDPDCLTCSSECDEYLIKVGDVKIREVVLRIIKEFKLLSDFTIFAGKKIILSIDEEEVFNENVSLSNNLFDLSVTIFKLDFGLFLRLEDAEKNCAFTLQNSCNNDSIEFKLISKGKPKKSNSQKEDNEYTENQIQNNDLALKEDALKLSEIINLDDEFVDCDVDLNLCDSFLGKKRQ